jgi:hypothetical protein
VQPEIKDKAMSIKNPSGLIEFEDMRLWRRCVEEIGLKIWLQKDKRFSSG